MSPVSRCGGPKASVAILIETEVIITAMPLPPDRTLTRDERRAYSDAVAIRVEGSIREGRIVVTVPDLPGGGATTADVRRILEVRPPWGITGSVAGMIARDADGRAFTALNHAVANLAAALRDNFLYRRVITEYSA